MSEHTVSGDDADIRLDRWFKRHFPHITHGLLEKHLRKGDIRVDGKKAKSSDRVWAGQVIRLKAMGLGLEERSSKPNKAHSLKPDDERFIQSLVLYKDANIIILNKPYGLPVQGGSKIARSLDDLLDGLAFGGDRPKLTHRLDRDTTGCLVLARTAKAAAQLMKIFSSRRIEKTYLALVNGCPLDPEGVIDQPMLKKQNPKASGTPGGPEGRDYEIMQVDAAGQKAVTEYRVRDACARRFALMELKPQTGRTHQLRVHMQAIACPIVGDHKYGGATQDAESLGVENKLHLHAWRIAVPALAGGKPVEAIAPLPSHMTKSLKALGIDIPRK
ncbi:MAG: RluA family pseudouridine synthase [Pseudomonadota bacterium]|nr:RluA family pseudouridine synthase [Pseudomonadota bacterium]